MSSFYKFSPIKDKDELLDAASYVIKEIGTLSKQLIGSELPVSSVKIFAHYPEEYQKLKELLGTLGEPTFETYTSMYVTLHNPITVNGQTIELLGIRIPDPYRSQVGCGDFVIEGSYDEFEKKHIVNNDPTSFVRKAVGHTLNMIEFWHPDSYVLGYVLAPDSEWAK